MSRWLMESIEDRLLRGSIPEPNSGCVLWLSACRDGYGRIGIGTKLEGRRSILAHRLAYECERGRIPQGLQIDHLCRVRSCINPRHMEPVTQQINILRGESLSTKNAIKATCPRGHPYDMVQTVREGRTGSRWCRTCTRAWDRIRPRRRRADRRKKVLV